MDHVRFKEFSFYFDGERQIRCGVTLTTTKGIAREICRRDAQGWSATSIKVQAAWDTAYLTFVFRNGVGLQYLYEIDYERPQYIVEPIPATSKTLGTPFKVFDYVHGRMRSHSV